MLQGRHSRAEWIVRNRQVRASAVPVGECLGGLSVGWTARSAIRRTIADWVDDGFRQHCTLGSMENGAVEILVDSAAECAALRLQWLTRLREHLARSCPKFGTRRVVFRVGRSDDRFDAPGLGRSGGTVTDD